MAIFNNSIIPAAAAADGDVVTKSLRCDSASSAHLVRTPSSTSATRTKWVFSTWAKRSKLGASMPLYQSTHPSSLDIATIHFGADDRLEIARYASVGGYSARYLTERVFRDPSAFYHITVVFDTTAAEADRVKLYVNGVRETAWNIETRVGPSATWSYGTEVGHMINNMNHTSSVGGGYYADVYWLDGTVTLPSGFTKWCDVFAEEDGTTGQWKPKATTGLTFGTNGFHLDFEDADAIGNDVSGNDNVFTATNLDTWDIVPDNPSAGMNYATLNPLQVGVGTNGDAPENGSLKVASGSNPRKAYSSTIGANSGKFYAEVYDVGDSYPMVSVSDVNKWVANSSSGQIKGDGSVAYDIKAAGGGGEYYINSASGDGGLSITPAAGDIIMIAFDADTRKVWYGRNGTWNDGGYGTGNPSAGTNEVGTVSGTDDLVVVVRAEGTDMHCNFGQEPSFDNNKTSGADTSQSEFYYAPPTDFKSLSTGNLPTPTIAKPAAHFNTVTYAGASGNADNDITTVGFQADLTWLKTRSNVGKNSLYDSVRGVTKELYSDTTGVEYTDTEGLQSWDGDGFLLGSDGETNNDGWTFVAWNWLAGTSFEAEDGVSDSGSKNVDAGFSIATWTGDDSGGMGGYSQEISHGLGVAPELIIAKNRTDGSTFANGDWMVYHKDLDSGDLIKLNDSSAAYTPTGYTVISGVTDAKVDFDSDSMEYDYLNYDGDTYVAYFMASVEGYSKVGSYEGNLDADGPFIYTGFRPRFILSKNADRSGVHWNIHDAVRDPYNLVDTRLWANLSNAEDSLYDKFDFLSNGFKPRTADTGHNGNDETIIYYAVAESPFKYASAR